jgi:hypothetical protein
VAAVVNGLIVLVLPFAVAAVGSSMGFGRMENSVTVHPPGWSGLLAAIQGLIAVGMVLLPFAVLAAWRTWVHARRWRDRGDRGWQGVAEAGACGVGAALLVLLPGIVTRPMDAAPYVTVYGGAALVVGLVVGLLLRMAALVVLKLTNSAA